VRVVVNSDTLERDDSTGAAVDKLLACDKAVARYVEPLGLLGADEAVTCGAFGSGDKRR
jgi:hypothetical protein